MNDLVWVHETRLRSGKGHTELVQVPAGSLPDGVGFQTREDADAFAKRNVWHPPVWLDPLPGHEDVVRQHKKQVRQSRSFRFRFHGDSG